MAGKMYFYLSISWGLSLIEIMILSKGATDHFTEVAFFTEILKLIHCIYFKGLLKGINFSENWPVAKLRRDMLPN